MKQVSFFIILFLLCFKSFSQVRSDKLTGIQIDSTYQETILKIIEEFTSETRRRGIYIDHHISSDLGGIRVLSKEEMTEIDTRRKPSNAVGITYRLISEDILGYWHRTPMIGIREDVITDYKLAKIILFHELGHFYGLGHVNQDKIDEFGLHIMCATLTSEYKKYEIPYNSMEDFFESLRINDKKWMKRNSNNK